MFLQMVSLLLSKGANARAKDKKERQAIHWAAYQGECCHTLTLIWFLYEKEQIRIREHLGNTCNYMFYDIDSGMKKIYNACVYIWVCLRQLLLSYVLKSMLLTVVCF